MLYSVFRLLFEKSCGEVDVFGCNLLASKPLRQVFSIIKAERFIRTFSVQFLSPVGIDMVHHQLYVCLRQFIKASSFRQDPAYKLMSHLDLCFLIRRTWIAVIEMCIRDRYGTASGYSSGADGFRDRQQGRESPADDIFCKCVTDAGVPAGSDSIIK